MSTPAQTSPLLCAPWATLDDVPPPVVAKLAEVTPADWARHLLASSELLFMLSGRRWLGEGSCSEQAMLRAWPPGAGQGSWPYKQVWGRWGWWAFTSLLDTWAMPPLNWFTATTLRPMAIQLPRDSITAVTEVTVDGTVLDPQFYRLTGAGWLERLDHQPWELGIHDVVISYTFGKPPPEGGVQAVVALATEFAKDSVGLPCKLPQRVTSVTRQGISFQAIDPMTFLPRNQTGLYRVDLWLQAVNPGGRSKRATVWSPDLPRAIHGAP
jgi:hypothetical protein